VEVTVVNAQRGQRLSTRGLSTFLRRLSREAPHTPADSLAVRLVSDRSMRAYNRRFRSVDSTTDVLAFAGDLETDPEGRTHLGDIVISATSAARQARTAGHSLAREARILALHGYLHLLGYDHERDDGEMQRIERRLLRRLLPRTSRRPGG